MFDRLTLHGGAGSILWGHREAIALRSWSIAQDAQTKAWRLTGSTARIDAFQSRQRPLLFAAPRPQGFWLWQIETIDRLGPTTLVATLGPPER